MNLLTVVTFLPLLGALAMVLVPRDEPSQHRALALVASLVTFALSLGLWFGFDASPGAPEFQFELMVPWMPTIGIGFHVGIDGVALLLFMLTTVLMPVVVLSAWKAVGDRVKEFMIALLVLESAMLGTFIALDLVLFYVFWEAMLIPMYLLIGIWGSQNRLYATVKFFVYTFAASVLMLLAILYVYFHDGGTFDYVEARRALAVTPGAASWLFLAFALAFAVKVPMFPLHTWLPDAHTEAPTAGSVILAGVLLKMGTFGFFRYALPLFPEAALQHRNLVAVLAVIGIIYGALMSLVQTDMKRLVAYSSVSHLGFVMLGLMALSAEGMTGSVYQMLNHGVSTGALFLLVGMLYERRHTRLISEYGGIAKRVPVIAAAFVIVTLSSIGLPGTNGFVGEFLILSGTWLSRLGGSAVFATVAALGVILGAVYMLLLVEKVFFGPNQNPQNHRLPDLSVREGFVLAPMIALIVVMGLLPGPFLAPAKPAVDRLIQRFQVAEARLGKGPQVGTAVPAVMVRAPAPAPAAEPAPLPAPAPVPLQQPGGNY
ncbi:proton-translocating NADH-quinone oxidoreductase, chain M [Anaeromyxobacter dehalogenans 2CP-1]|uniref:Proton-translocating NADH-quinone oxidoreductase, chain M n=1 Tax=Anaeromyxobacter dehalogenans (strain ATCC BAA-258 / DSM 21875 / 2CP-1) TaxID=455488 RepID=B8JAY9_ANAD2|nr:NADH-quinone oxidoreductase subunit M [Anaeromyxobacter dehalogenans]ACL63800.1 proton-translocating NADH-quinone oxidoreductase, chain M [Anaeromyxobacter dehalogenans 2CP-1]